MKNVRIILSVFAFIVAIAAAFASKQDASITGYEFHPAIGGVPAWCEAKNNVCDDNGTYTCQVTQSSPILGVSNTPDATSCGLAAKRLTQAPM
jgi:hypothetical protein